MITDFDYNVFQGELDLHSFPFDQQYMLFYFYLAEQHATTAYLVHHLPVHMVDAMSSFSKYVFPLYVYRFLSS